ncbi:hypothetical protein FHR90_000259 [Endobacter medicaginis]|uniref:MFS transporter n=1 Tax=Endobacter medicaginis TaxID=1181271 RepID=A0A839UVP0_9PROT|nr:hypothetical protein [Endobacter medicaginis]
MAIVGATLVLPFLFGSTFAGRLAERCDRARLARHIKTAELGCTVVAMTGLCARGHAVAALLYLALLGYGVCAALFGPVKYALLPDHLPKPRLPAANAAIETTTFLAILAGTFAGGLNGSALLDGRHDGPRLALAAALLATAAIALIAAMLIPPAPPRPAGERDGALPGWRGLDPAIAAALVAGTWFWLAGSLAMALLPVLVQQTLGGDSQAAALALGAFALGIGPGAVLAARWQHGRISLAPALAGSVGLGLAMLDLCRRAAHLSAPAGPARDWQALLAAGTAPMLADAVAMAVCAGLIGVPAGAILQAASPPGQRARWIARANTLSAAAMVAGALAIAALQRAGIAPTPLFGALGALGPVLATLGAAWWRSRQLRLY